MEYLKQKNQRNHFWLNTKDADKPQANTCGWRKEQENVCDRYTIDFGFTS